ncbi:MAG: hypothetical protein IJR26_08165 [Bacteroidales bacterium]|nr:hypothetical protein [Bacteroidales bacterium]
MLFSVKTFVSEHGKAMMNAIMAVFALKQLYDLFHCSIQYIIYNDVWNLHEFYINYQGGFVRRGLWGELLFQLCSFTGWNPQLIVGVFCLFCFLFVVIVFVHLFKKNNISWWILPLSIFLANDHVVRKDFFFIVSLLLILYIYRGSLSNWIKLLLINIISVFTLLSHEAFFFVCIPMLTLLILRDKENIPWLHMRIMACIPPFIAMAFACFYHGDVTIAQSIQSSWCNIIPGFSPELPCNSHVNPHAGSIGALAWTSDFAFQYHLSLNFFQSPLHVPGSIIRPAAIILIFYFIVNYIRFYSKFNTAYKLNGFVYIFLFQFLSLLPMFTVLSCDTQRICFYWLCSTFAFFLLIPASKQKGLFPYFYIFSVSKLYKSSCRLLPSGKFATTALIFIMSAPSIGNEIINALTKTVVVQYYRIIIDALSLIS